MTTYRERRERKAARLEEWAGKREVKAEGLQEQTAPFRGDIAFITQPGHDMQRLRDKLNAKDEKAWEHQNKANEMRDRAEGISRQLDQSIYSDDPDAIERLQERIADLESQRDRIKTYNASCRKGQRDLSLLTEKEKTDLISALRYSMADRKGAFPPYVLSNLNGNINRQKKRLEQLKGGAA